MPISHLESPWKFLRVRYIIILLVFPFRLYWFVVLTFIFSNHPSDWQRGWFGRLIRAFVEVRYALASNELVIKWGWGSLRCLRFVELGLLLTTQTNPLFFALISSLPVSTVLLESNLGLCDMDIAVPRCDSAYRTIGEPVASQTNLFSAIPSSCLRNLDSSFSQLGLWLMGTERIRPVSNSFPAKWYPLCMHRSTLYLGFAQREYNSLMCPRLNRTSSTLLIPLIHIISKVRLPASHVVSLPSSRMLTSQVHL